MRPAPLLALLLWAPLLWAPPVRDHRHGVHWNGSNPRFLRDDYTIQVAINDYLDIYCPHYEGTVPAGRAETFTLFMVDQEGYRGCYETPGAFKRWVCNRPHAPFGPVRFSEKIQRFTPFSLGFEFQPGETYYYISIPSPESTGRCLKLRVYVCCRGTTPEPVTEVPNSQPRGRGGPEGISLPAGITKTPAPLAILPRCWAPCGPCSAPGPSPHLVPFPMDPLPRGGPGTPRPWSGRGVPDAAPLLPCPPARTHTDLSSGKTPSSVPSSPAPTVWF
ncbi:ephrin-A4 isoform X1 [Cuculus canorus]|uniref:ephrin-A4 isoform X1 n=1 Tax=Cuculus canorus TaxID=55661 RepID=UPI0023AAB690|nr:ephrin-A4 isoform X1 [Cuculus canorus]